MANAVLCRMRPSKVKCAILVTTGFLACVAGAADTSVAWSPSETSESLADGKLLLTYEDGKVKTMTASPAQGDRIVVSGAELKLAADAAITMETTGALVFKNKLDGTGTLSFQTTLDELHYQKTVPEGLIDAAPNWTLMFPDANLDDYEPVAALQGNGRGDGLANPNDFYAYNIRRFKDDDGRSVVEFQLKYLNGEDFFKCVKMQLRQGEGGIEGSVINTWNASDMTGSIETDVDYMMEHEERFPTCKVYGVRTPSEDGGYGVCCLDLKPIRPLVQFENFVSNTVKKTTLDLSIGTSVEVRGVGGSAFGPNSYTGARQVDGQLTILDRTVTVKSPLSGGGTLRVASETPLSDNPFVSPGSSGNYLTDDEYQTTTYRFLDELTNVTAGLTGKAIDPNGKSTVWSPRFYHYEIADNGLVATCQVQVVTKDKKNIGCSFIEFKQTGYSNIKMHVVRAGLTPESKGLGVDFRTLSDSDVTWTNVTEKAAGEGISMLRPTNYWSTASRRMVILGAGESGYTFSSGARIEVEGSEGVEQCLDFSSTNAIPHNGTIVAKNGGNVFFMKGSGNAQAKTMDSSCLWRAEAGGHLWLPYVKSGTASTVGTIGPRQEIELWGGQFHVGSFPGGSATTTLPAGRESGNYLCLLTLADGAVVDGLLSVNVGNVNNDATWKVRGIAPSYCNVDLKMTSGSSNGRKYFRWDVADVTADDGEDLFVNGRLGRYDSDNTHSNIVMRKVGAGTIRINCPNTVDKMVLSQTELYEGTWMLGADGVSCSRAPYLMTGGSIAAADGTVNDVGVLSVVSNGTIKVGAGGALRFADSSAASWTLPAGGRIIVDADLSANALRFGTDANGLTSAQLRMLRKPDGKTRIELDANGWARDYVPGAVVIFR